MSSVAGVWDQIMDIAREQGMPDRPRAILREYLQAKVLNYLYMSQVANKLSFVGGTSLRLLRELPRFSEDLDFDNLGLSERQIEELIRGVRDKFLAENVPVEMVEKRGEGKVYYQLRFPQLLKELAISSDPREKLMIKVDYANIWRGQITETKLLNRWGVVQQVIVNSLDQILVQKLVAYTERLSTQPRDMYDVVWLWAQGARLDRKFIKMNDREGLIEKVRARLNKEGVSGVMERKLEPFLFLEEEKKKLSLFGEVVEKLGEAG